MSNEEAMRQAIDAAFAEFPGQSVTIEALLPLVSRKFGRPVNARVIERVLNAFPSAYQRDNAGRWSVVQPENQGSEEDEPEETPTNSGRTDWSWITPGCYVVFDLETSGRLDAGDEIEILQVAAQRYMHFQPDGEPFMRFARLEGQLKAAITHLTGITLEQLQEAPPVEAALAEFFDYVGGLPLVAHNGALFDGPVIRKVAARKSFPLPAGLLVLDTLPLARALLPLGKTGSYEAEPLNNHRLGTLAQYYNCVLPNAHQADVDVAMLGGVTLGLIKELTDGPQAKFILTLLQRASDPWAALSGVRVDATNLDLAELFNQFGENATPLLEPRQAGNSSGPTEQAIETILDGYTTAGKTRRPPQAQLAHLAGDVFLNDRFAVVEAGTGTGKGLGYLGPSYLQARASGQPVVVSTYTRVLQDQLYNKDLEFLGKVVSDLTPGEELKRALLKGRRNYLSSRCLAEEWQDAWEEGQLEAGRAWGLATLAGFARVTVDGDLGAVNGAFTGLANLIEKNHHTYMLLDAPAESEGTNADTWNLLERVRVTAEVLQAPWPAGLPRSRPDFLKTAQLNASRADIVVVNHSLLLTKALRESEKEQEQGQVPSPDQQPSPPPGLLSSYLVCDEAHTLEDAATSVLTRSVGLRQLRRILIALIGPGGWRGGAPGGLLRTCRNLGLSPDEPNLKELRRVGTELVAQLRSLGQYLNSYIERQVVVNREDRLRYGVSAQLTRRALTGPGGPALNQAGQQFLQLLEQLFNVLDELAAPLARQAENAGRARRVARAERIRLAALEELNELVESARWFWKFWDENSTIRVVQFEPGEVEQADWSLKGMPVAVGALMYAGLWSKLKAAIVTSATVTTAADGFDFYLGRVGLNRLEIGRVVTEVLPYAFDYHSNALFMLPNHLPTPRGAALRKAYPEAVAAELRRFIPYFEGRSLALFTARSRMETVHEQAVGALEKAGLPLLTQDEAEAIERFKADERVSLLGVRSLWEGVDVPGKSLSYVLIEKFPFPSLGDPLEAARMAAVERAGGDGFYQYLLPRAIFQFKQGFGRLIRSDSDHGAVVMLDKRLRSAMYRGEVLASLPNPTIGYESDLEMYRRICEWMGIPFDPSQLPPSADGKALEILNQNMLPSNFIAEAEWESVARPRLEAVLKALWGSERTLRPFQVEAIKAVLAGRDVLTLAPTGSGKSLTYQLPALVRHGCTLVISPLIALIKDQVSALREKLGLSVVNCLVSGMSAAEQEEVLAEARAGRVRLLYLAPERLRDPRFRATLAQLPLVQLVVDEAHCISTWGHDFRPDFLEITRLLPATGGQRVPVHAVTATATPKVQAEIREALGFGSIPGRPAPFTHLADQQRENLVYRVYHCQNATEGEARVVELVKQLLADQQKGGSGIVYVARRASADRLAELLRNANISSYAYHGGLQPAERHNIQELFMHDEIKVVCCTNAFGMGVDKSDIRFVIHYDHPSSLEAYAQETGRAGRDGQEAYAILLYNAATQRTHRSIARKGWQDQGVIPELLKLLAQMADNNRVLTSFEILSERLNVDEVALRVLVYNAEQAGLLKRGQDVILNADLLLSLDIDQITASLADEPQRLEARRLLNFLAGPRQRHPLSATNSVRLRYDAFSWQQAGGDPLKAGALLSQLSESQPENCIFRPFARGLTLEITSQASEAAFNQLSETFYQRYANFEQRLQKMLDFVDLPAGQCRRAYLDNYLLGGQLTVKACGKCDQCAPSYSVPWNDRRIEGALQAVTKLPSLSVTDAAMEILEALRDHDGYFSAHTIIKMLLGEAFGHSRDGGNYPISPTARNSEHFGALKTARLKTEQLQALLNQLLNRGYIEIKARQYQVNGEQAEYNALALTQAGRDVLAGERSLDLDSSQTSTQENAHAQA
ncbi:MAG TPA: RecQ family ATP-dependent DNA helicase [Chloroflexia bacterium]|nr:RecQ family ATP-dependent DNA helicase [Chloroflexia bacterium]